MQLIEILISIYIKIAQMMRIRGIAVQAVLPCSFAHFAHSLRNFGNACVTRTVFTSRIAPIANRKQLGPRAVREAEASAPGAVDVS